MSDLYYMTIDELAPLIQEKKLSPVELTQSVLHRIQHVDSIVNSYITVTQDEALKRAKQAEAEIMQGNYRGPLHGIPIAPNDLFFTEGIRTTLGSELYKNFVPKYNATTIDKLLQGGIIIPGKVNLHEFAAGITNVNVHYGDARNPWNPNHITGGSSGGSGAAVAAGTAIASLGTDSDGSIRIPSAMCGVYGLKTTYGRVSKYGVKDLYESLTSSGPMARSVADLAIILQYMSGYDSKDTTSARVPVHDYISCVGQEIKGMKIGIVPDYFFKYVDTEVETLVKKAIRGLQSLGAEIIEVKIPELDMTKVAEMVVASSEASVEFHDVLTSNLKKYLQDDVRIVFETGELMTGVQYIRAQKARRFLLDRFMETYNKVEVIAAPTIPITAPPFIENKTKLNLEVWNRIIPLTAPANLTGLPSLSVPVGLSSDRLPIGMQLFGKPFEEGTLIKVASAYESIMPFNNLYRQGVEVAVNS